MPYSEDKRRAALDCLAAHDGDYQQTSARLGISVRTLRRWSQQAQVQGDEVNTLKAQLQTFSAQMEAQQNDVADAEALVRWLSGELPLQLAQKAIQMLDAVDEEIEDAPLNQRVAALGRFVDLIIKLRQLAPPSSKAQELHVKYINPGDDLPRDAPFWASEDFAP